MKQIEVVAAIFTKMSFEKGYEIFCVQRPGPKPGAEPKETDFKWEFPGGKIEEGESHEDALRREIWEELQTTISVDDFLMTVEHQYTNFKVKLHFYYCTPNGPFEIQEHIEDTLADAIINGDIGFGDKINLHFNTSTNEVEIERVLMTNLNKNLGSEGDKVGNTAEACGVSVRNKKL